MQVKISFTVDLEEVPKKVDEALQDAYRNMQEVIDGHMAPVTKYNVQEMMIWMDKARKQILRVDTRLMECYSMLAGYNKAIADSYLPQSEEQQDTPQENPDVNT